MSFLEQPITLQSLFGQKRMLGDITLSVVMSESTSDDLTITKQPVQQGASITDHAFMEPTVLSMQAYFASNFSLSPTTTFQNLQNTFSSEPGSSYLSKVYDQLIQLQKSRSPFIILTPKRIYRDMLLASLKVTTDKTTENCLSLNMTFQQVILVSVSTTTLAPPARQKNKKQTQSTEKAGKKSALKTTFDAGKEALAGVIK